MDLHAVCATYPFNDVLHTPPHGADALGRTSSGWYEFKLLLLTNSQDDAPALVGTSHRKSTSMSCVQALTSVEKVHDEVELVVLDGQLRVEK